MKWYSLRIIRVIVYTFLIVGVYLILLNALIEVETDEPDHMLTTLFDAVWFTLVTITTVGYGDIVPVSDLGKLISLIFILFGLSLYSLLIGGILNTSAKIREKRRIGHYGTNMKNHIVIIGWNNHGKAVADQLLTAGRKLSIFTEEKENVELIRERYAGKNVFVVYADLDNFEYLKKTNIVEAYSVFINLKEDSQKLVYLLNLKKYFGEKQYVVNIDNGDLKHTFESAGAVYVISKNDLSSKLLASYIFEPDVAMLSEEIISYAVNDNEHDIKQFKVLKGNPYIGLEYNKVFFDLKSTANAVLLALSREDENQKTMYKNPSSDLMIKEGDFLIMLVSKLTVQKISRIFNTKEGVNG